MRPISTTGVRVLTALTFAWLVFAAAPVLAEDANEKVNAALEMPLTAEFIETPIGDVSRVVRMKLGVGFRFHDDVYPSIKVTYHAEGEKLKVVLKKMLAKIRCEYVVKDQSIFIQPIPGK